MAALVLLGLALAPAVGTAVVTARPADTGAGHRATAPHGTRHAGPVARSSPKARRRAAHARVVALQRQIAAVERRRAAAAEPARRQACDLELLALRQELVVALRAEQRLGRKPHPAPTARR